MQTPLYGLDIAKRVFQTYWAEPEKGKVINRKFYQQKLIEFFWNRNSGTVALEEGGSAHWWARKLRTMGHDVKLLDARYAQANIAICPCLLRSWCSPLGEENRIAEFACARKM